MLEVVRGRCSEAAIRTDLSVTKGGHKTGRSTSRDSFRAIGTASGAQVGSEFPVRLTSQGLGSKGELRAVCTALARGCAMDAQLRLKVITRVKTKVLLIRERDDRWPIIAAALSTKND